MEMARLATEPPIARKKRERPSESAPPAGGLNGMGHYCRICETVRANEAFSGEGRRGQVCRRCMPLAAEFDADEEVRNFLRQSHISTKNIARLRQIAASADSRRAEWAAVILEIALVTPYRRRRLKRLARQHRDLLAKLVRCGLMDDDYSSIGNIEPAVDENGPSAGPIDDEIPLVDGPPGDLPSEQCEAGEEFS